jgi:hypothetical protein
LLTVIAAKGFPRDAAKWTSSHFRKALYSCLCTQKKTDKLQNRQKPIIQPLLMMPKIIPDDQLISAR